jgi:hypothetical protein
MKHVVSFSGGRTSAYLVHLMEEKRKNEGLDVEYVFMDTGAEHPKTYEFIRNVAAHYELGERFTCLRSYINPEMNIGPTFRVVGLSDIGWDLSIWLSMSSKHGNPYIGGAFCTERLKTEPFRKYCESRFGKGGYLTVLGIRMDEPGRVWGKIIWTKLVKYQFSNRENKKLWLAARNGDLSQWHIDSSLAEKMKERAALEYSVGKRYMLELSDLTKEGVLKFWQEMPFDLELDEWLGNCAFCFKKSIKRVGVAMMQEPELLEEWKKTIQSERVRQVRKNEPERIMYRGKLDIDGVLKFHEGTDAEQVAESMRVYNGCNIESGGSCEVFGCQGDLFEGEAA